MAENPAIFKYKYKSKSGQTFKSKYKFSRQKRSTQTKSKFDTLAPCQWGSHPDSHPYKLMILLLMIYDTPILHLYAAICTVPGLSTKFWVDQSTNDRVVRRTDGQIQIIV